MTVGRAAKFAFDPQVLVDYLEACTVYRTDGTPQRTRRLINGRYVDPATDARIIRRWRKTAEGVTKPAADRLLRKFKLTIPEFVRWAKSNGRAPVLRGTL